MHHAANDEALHHLLVAGDRRGEVLVARHVAERLQAIVLRVQHPRSEKLEDDAPQALQIREDVDVVLPAGQRVEDGASPERQPLNDENN